MRRVRAVGLLVLVVSVGFAVAALGQSEDDGPDCIQPPNVSANYGWTYELGDGGTREVQVVRTSETNTPQGLEPTIQFEYQRLDDEGDRTAYGQQVRYGENATYPWGLLRQSRWDEQEDTVTRRIDGWDPPFRIVHLGGTTCPGDFISYTTHHTTSYGPYTNPQHHEDNETWQVRAGHWTNVTVPAGTFEVLPVHARQGEDPTEAYQITVYWSPEVDNVVKRVQGPAGTVERSANLTDYVLDQRPIPIFGLEPTKPRVGDTITLNATASFDPDGEIASYEWRIGNRTLHGPIVRYNASEETALSIRLTVTDEANRTASQEATVYVAPRNADGLSLSGPSEGLDGQIVTLEAHTSFDPVQIRWRTGDTIVGDGPTYRFYLEDDRNLTVDAIHPSGRVYTANHSVRVIEGEPVERPEFSSSGGLAILEPLEGQIVPANAEIRIRTDVDAMLLMDDERVWRGHADPAETVEVELDHGRHTLTLRSGPDTVTTNVTVPAEGTGPGDGSPDTGRVEDANSSDRSAPLPSAGAALLGFVALFTAALTRRR